MARSSNEKGALAREQDLDRSALSFKSIPEFPQLGTRRIMAFRRPSFPPLLTLIP